MEENGERQNQKGLIIWRAGRLDEKILYNTQKLNARTGFSLLSKPTFISDNRYLIVWRKMSDSDVSLWIGTYND